MDTLETIELNEFEDEDEDIDKPLAEEQIADLLEGFMVFDKFEDGSMPTKELGRLVHALGKIFDEAELQDMTEELDPNDKGTIIFPDFLAMMTRKMRYLDPEEELHEAFRILDNEGNGCISCELLKEILTTMGEPITDREADELNREADFDSDGQIVLDDFYTMMMTKL